MDETSKRVYEHAWAQDPKFSHFNGTKHLRKDSKLLKKRACCLVTREMKLAITNVQIKEEVPQFKQTF